MKLSDLSIRRPVLASMLSLALVLFGAIGYTQLAVRESEAVTGVRHPGLVTERGAKPVDSADGGG